MEMLLGCQENEGGAQDVRRLWYAVAESITGTIRHWNDYRSCASLQELAVFLLWGAALFALFLSPGRQSTVIASVSIYGSLAVVFAVAFVIPCAALLVRCVRTFMGLSCTPGCGI